MADYILSAKITGDSKSFEDAFERSQNKIKNFNGKVDGMGTKISDGGKKMQGFGTKTMLATAPLTIFAKKSIDTGRAFGASMSKVQALSGATGSELNELEKSAREMGATTRYSASEAADALGYMALAGWDTTQMMDGLPHVLGLATAGQLELATASDIVTDMMSMFSLDAKDAAIATDVFAYAQANANYDVEQLADALRYAGPAAAAAGHDIQQTSAVLGMFANQGIKGSKAGTTLNAMYRDLQKNAKNGAVAIGGTSVAIYDAQGKMRSMSDIMVDVEKATKGMTDEQKNAALSSIFQQESLKGVNLLLNEGSGELKNFEKELYNSKGATEEMSKTMDDNLDGSFKNLNSAVEELQLRFFETAEGPMRKFVDKITGLIIELGKLDDSTLQTIVAIAGIAIAIGPAMWALGIMTDGVGKLISMGAKLGGALLSPVGLISSAFVGLAYVLINALVPGDSFLEKMKNLGAYIAEMASGIIPHLKDAFSQVISVVTNLATSIGSFLSPTFEIIKSSFMDLAVSALPFVVNGFMMLVNVAVTVAQAIMNIASIVLPVLIGIFNELVPIISSIIGIIFDIGTQLTPLISTLMSALIPTITTVISTVMNIVQTVAPGVVAILNVIIAVIKAMIPIIMSIITVVVNVVSVVISTIQPIVAFVGMIINSVMAIIIPIVVFVANTMASVISVITPIIAAVTGIFTTVHTIITGVFISINTFIAGVINRISSVIGTLSSTVSSVFNKIYSIVSSIMNRVSSVTTGVFAAIRNAWTGLTGFVNGVFSGIGNAVSNLVNQVKGFVNGVTGGINAAIGIINKIPGVNISRIPQLYRGTDDWPGGFARMNEGGRGELTYLPNGSIVIPHDISMKYAKESARVNNQFDSDVQNIGGNQYIKVEMKDANIYDTRDTEEIGKDLAEQISREVVFG
ncbi:phage tail tape measure protein [Anaerosalibacter massiliensis]|uniref:Phage tail tape measure protein n=1 Tax=Anaerosalibacter massiliensis TaxID=1347392 RepID=A0A9X2MKW8_9FIRM|nr:phage tail tape measure protein [Anaerosalibacter massiliensis]MCR2045484.1 phage tail tape measure protein [Anaerosalibacter massiliensis]